MDRQSALHFGVGLGFFSVLLMGLATNWLAAALLAASILFYVLIYTVWLKPRTPHNIVIGGAAGAFPPLIGWVAATGHFAALPLLLFAIIFLWTPPHFWALSLFVRSDYAAAGIPMLPVVAGIENTRRQIFLYSLPMAALAVAFMVSFPTSGSLPLSVVRSNLPVRAFTVTDPLLDEAWGHEEYPNTRTVDNHLVKLRRALEDEPDKPRWLVTVHGAGYKLDVPKTAVRWGQR